VEEGVRRVSEQIVTGIFTLLGVVVGLFGERWVRRLGRVRYWTDWQVQRGEFRAEVGTVALERQLKVTFLNRKDVGVTVQDMRVEFYNREGQLLGEEERPYLYFIDPESNEWSAPGPVDLPPGRTVQQTISLTLGEVQSGSVTNPEPARQKAVEGAAWAVFVARIVGAWNKRRKLSPPW
jgi:hypothetical protein